MYHHFVPVSLHSQAEALIEQLTAVNNTPSQCPYCQHEHFYIIKKETTHYRCKNCKKGFSRSVGTPYFRLASLEWLPLIAQYRLCGKRYTAIRRELGECSHVVVKHRVTLIEQHMEEHFPLLYDWYQTFITADQSNQPIQVKQEAKQLKNWVETRLQATHICCPYCQSQKTQKIVNGRARRRCQTCWRYFSNLKGSGLEYLSYSQHWLTMIDMLTAKNTIKHISETLKINHHTTSKARRTWLYIMLQQELFVLKEWIGVTRSSVKLS